MPAFRVEPATLEFRVVPGCPPGPALSCGRASRRSCRAHGVADATLQRAQCFFAGLAFGELAVVVGAALACRARIWVTAIMWIAWFNFRFPRGFSRCRIRGPLTSFDRCGAVVRGEVSRGREPGEVADV